MKTQTRLQIGILIIGLAASVTCRAQPGLMETTVVNFDGTNGAAPVGELIQGTDGQLCGTTSEGGAFGWGTIFKTTLEGSLTSLFSFNGTNGAFPVYAPLQTADGNLYGISFNGGNGFNGTIGSGQGTIYQLSSNGVLSILVAFSGTNGSQPGCLIFGNDGNLYGMTASGGAFTNDQNSTGDGTAFEITTNGQFTMLTSFNGTNGASPRVLIQGSDGNFYGVTEYGGTYGDGTVFQMTTNGNVTNLFSFAGTNGASPFTLIQGSDGALYGTTLFGGTGFSSAFMGYGTVFRITTNGSFSVLASFSSANGAVPNGRLIEITNGVFYGTTGQGGEVGHGALFQITTNGGPTLLYSFGEFEQLPALPTSGLVMASDSNFYGVGQGGPDEGGVFAIRPFQAPVLQASLQNDQMNLSWYGWAGYSYVLVYATNLTDANWNFLGTNANVDIVPQTNGPVSYSDSISVDPQRFYRLYIQLP